MAESTNQKRFGAFKKRLGNLFKRFYPGGRCEAELLLGSDHEIRSAHSRPQKGGIKIRCCFDSKQQGRNGAELDGVAHSKLEEPSKMPLSQGQQTVISVCLMLALASCNHNNLFYCLDEIDAELDSKNTSILKSM